MSNQEDEPDFLDELIEEYTEKNPEFPQLLEEAAMNRSIGEIKALAFAEKHPGPANIRKAQRKMQARIRRNRFKNK